MTVTCTDAKALADGMQELLAHETTYHRLFDQARAHTFHSWDDYIRELFREIGIV